MLLVAFAFAVMADPVSSVAYAIEAALRALDGDLGLLLPTMTMVIAVIAVVTLNYHQIVARYPAGGGAAAAVGDAFGERWAFVPIAALVVDFTLTIAISAAAGASAIIAYLPALGGWRLPLALALIVGVAGLTWFGHLGRAVFATMTLTFLALAVVVLVYGLAAHPQPQATSVPATSSPAAAVVLAFPVAMALATGVEAPASAIAQLDQLDGTGRRRFGRITLWLTLAIVGIITLGLTAQAVHLRIGVPGPDSTQIAELARIAAPGPVFAAFQLATTLLLLSAASSSFQAGPGLLKALAAGHDSAEPSLGILPARLGRTNSHYTPYWGVLIFVVGSAALVTAAGGNDQRLVLFYAVAVFLSFLAGMLAMTRLSYRARQPATLAVNAAGALVVGFTLAVNLTRGAPLASMAATGLIALILHRLWVRSGRPSGIQQASCQCQVTRTAPRLARRARGKG
ncbi:amino acid permease (plasmid) [Mycolicibacterium vanbaalenii]|nr:amino acid permease [Mycolicibacterium vanbaalenii]